MRMETMSAESALRSTRPVRTSKDKIEELIEAKCRMAIPEITENFKLLNSTIVPDKIFIHH